MRDFNTAEYELNNPSKQLDVKWKYFYCTWAKSENITVFFSLFFFKHRLIQHHYFT